VGFRLSLKTIKAIGRTGHVVRVMNRCACVHRQSVSALQALQGCGLNGSDAKDWEEGLVGHPARKSGVPKWTH